MKGIGVIAIALIALAFTACGKDEIEDKSEVAQASGDLMSSLDESTQGASLAHVLPFTRDLEPKSRLARLIDFVIPEACAAGCPSTSFTSCSSSTMTRTFGGCTIGGSTLEGTVTLTFSDGSCSMSTVGASVTRTAEFTITGRRGATLKVTSPGGQKLTKTAEGFLFTGLGMKRVGTSSAGAEIFNVDTKTTEDILVTGTSRVNRIMNGGKIVITNNTKSYTATLTPVDLKWNVNCNCAISGKLTGSITGSVEADDLVIEVTGCGSARITANDEPEDVTLDRCAAI